jgi:hypothetical protein
VTGDQLVRLQEIADAVGHEMNVRGWEVTMLGVDASRGAVVLGTTEASAEMCRTLPERHGPLVEVIHQDGVD